MGIMLVEPAIVPDVFINGVVPEDLGDGTMRFTGFTRQKSITFDGIEYVVVNRVVMPVTAIMTSITETMRVLRTTVRDGGKLKLAH